MKAIITKKDGTVIELDGSAQEVREVIEGPTLPFHRTFSPEIYGPLPITSSPITPSEGRDLRLKKAMAKALCPKHNGHPWFGTVPPECSCGEEPINQTETVSY